MAGYPLLSLFFRQLSPVLGLALQWIIISMGMSPYNCYFGNDEYDASFNVPSSRWPLGFRIPPDIRIIGLEMAVSHYRCGLPLS